MFPIVSILCSPSFWLLCVNLLCALLSIYPSSISDNAVNPDGALRIAPLLESCLTLKTLILNNTGVGPSGGEACETVDASRFLVLSGAHTDLFALIS